MREIFLWITQYFFVAKIRKKQTLCRPNRAAVIPPQSPRGGRSGSARVQPHHKPQFFEKRLFRGRIRWFVLASVIAPLKTLP